MSQEKKIQLVWGGPEQTDVATRGVGEKFAAGIDDIKNWFKEFDVTSIELWISGGGSTGDIVKLFISAKAEGGMKVILKPKPTS